MSQTLKGKVARIAPIVAIATSSIAFSATCGAQCLTGILASAAALAMSTAWFSYKDQANDQARKGGIA